MSPKKRQQSPLKRVLLSLIGGFFLTISTLAQNNTPFSYFGIGEVTSTGFAQNQSMGNLQYGLRDTQHINMSNPASYDALSWTSLEFGFQGKSSRFTDHEGEQKQTFNGTLSYISFGFPITDNWGTSVGLTPFSTMKYSVTEFSPFQQDSLTHRYRGQGKLYRFYLGNSYDLLGWNETTSQSLSLGVNVSYIFGSLDQIEETEFPQGTNIINVSRQDRISVSDFLLEIGLQHQVSLNEELTFASGIQLTPLTKLYAEKELRWQRYERTSNNRKRLVSQGVNDSLTGRIHYPTQVGMGVTLSKEGRWTFGIDAKYEQWSRFKRFDHKSNFLKDNLRLSIGGEMSSLSEQNTESYWNYVKYRFGAFWNTGELRINGRPMPRMGLSAGIGLPVKDLRSSINISLQAGQQGLMDQNQFVETYYKTTIGFTLNDKWFVPSKIR